MERKEKISWIFNYLRQKTKQNVYIVKQDKDNTYFKLGNNLQILDLYYKTIDDIDTITGLIAEAEFQFNELVI